jgi:hypothetical protein
MINRRELLLIHQALVELELIAEHDGLDARTREVRALRLKINRAYWKVPYGYRLARNVTVNHGWYWRPDDQRSFSPQNVFPTKQEAIEDLYEYLAARKGKAA